MLRKLLSLSFLKLCLFACALNMLCSFAWLFYVLHSFEDYTLEGNYDVIIILMGDFNDDYSGLGKETQRRLNYALSMKETFGSKNIVCIGGSRPQFDVNGAELMKSYLVKHGFSSNYVHLGKNSFDTLGNWKEALQIINDNHWKNIGIISSALHLFRINATIIDHNIDLNISLMPFSYNTTTPQIGFLELWTSIQYEWIVYLLYSLPEPFYDYVINNARPQHNITPN